MTIFSKYIYPGIGYFVASLNLLLAFLMNATVKDNKLDINFSDIDFIIPILIALLLFIYAHASSIDD